MLESDCLVFIAADRDVISARQHGRSMAEAIGLGRTDQALIATAISELAQNILLHARRGEVHISVVTEGRCRGIRVTATDRGPGIDNIEKALEDGFSTHDRLGFGLAGTRRIVDEFEIASKPGEGTWVRVVKWQSP